MKKILALVMILALSLTCLAGCELPFELPFDLPFLGGEPTEPANTVTVSWYQGSKLLKEEEVEKGTKLTAWEPVVEGKTFTGWYAEASLTEPFDFEKAIEADTDIFAAFKSDAYTEDTNSYYLIGTGAGDMLQANWDHTNAANALTMTKEDVEGANVYTITLKMYAGDMFQICYGGSWDGQVGIGLMKGAEYADGYNWYASADVTAADKKFAQVKNEAGEVVFIGADEYNKTFEVWNAKLAEGQDGIYKITYTTYPDSKAYNQITFELVEKIEPMSVTHEMHLVGEFNSWKPDDDNADFHLKASDDKSTWSGFLTVTAEDLAADGTVEFKVVNQISQGWFSPDGGNIVLTEAGTYAVKYTVDGDKVEVEKCDYYIVGTLIDGEGAAVNYAVKAGVSPKLELQEDGSYVVSFTAYDATGLGDYSWMVDQGKTDPEGNAAIISIKVVYGAELGIKDWYSAEGGDNWYLSAGTYTVTLKDGAVTVAK